MKKARGALVLVLTVLAGTVGVHCSDDPAPAAPPSAAAGSGGAGGGSGGAGGGSGGAAGGVATLVPAPAFVPEYAAKRLAIKRARCEANNRIAGGPGKDCRNEAAPPQEEELDALLTGRTVLRPENAAPCIAALDAAADGDELSLAWALCANAPLAVGTVANGEACGRVSAGEMTICKDGYCANGTGYTAGICKPRKVKGEVAESGTTRPAHNPCAAGLEGLSTCTPLPSVVGAACVRFDETGARCVQSAYCDETTKLCVPLGAPGAACSSANACQTSCGFDKLCTTREKDEQCRETSDCAAGLRCLRATQQDYAYCLAVDATRCDPFQGAARCTKDQYCPLSGTCAPLPTAAAGAACVDGRCGPGLMCSDDRCVDPALPGSDVIGSACAYDKPCNFAKALVCVSGRCQQTKHLGEACGGPASCDSYTTCGEGGTCQPRGKVGATCVDYEQCFGECTGGTCQSPAGGA